LDWTFKHIFLCGIFLINHSRAFSRIVPESLKENDLFGFFALELIYLVLILVLAVASFGWIIFLLHKSLNPIHRRGPHWQRAAESSSIPVSSDFDVELGLELDGTSDLQLSEEDLFLLENSQGPGEILTMVPVFVPKSAAGSRLWTSVS
jgi:hypothetical protein